MGNEVKFKRINVSWESTNFWTASIDGRRRAGVSFCDDPNAARNGTGLSRYVEVPVTTDTIYLVFTNRPRKDGFEIKPDKRDSRLARLVGVRQYILQGFARFLRAQYDDGARYVHIEYE